ncbi:MAG: hypothetical protein HC809_08505 [Gammaproteobacteria bacterium]|nr:hypothetical protein [Gammaproteobacteria bacterium]
MDDDSLLEMRFKDLRLRISDSLVQPEIGMLYEELARREIGFRPHVWLSEEWFSPDGTPGIAIPFFVAHPRLRQLERNVMGEVEGGNSLWRLRILRHEAGHALDTAYGLRRRSDWRAMFGRASAPYPKDYTPRPTSQRHVLHLGHWYAQSHPTEDFAETFAVWLQPKARWRREYAEWPALQKLEFVDALMADVARGRPKVRDRSVVEPLSENTRTLGTYYRRKRAYYDRANQRYDDWLKRAFTSRRSRPHGVGAGRFVREIEPQLRRLLVRRTRMHPYIVDHAIARWSIAHASSTWCCAHPGGKANDALSDCTSGSCSMCCDATGRTTPYEKAANPDHHPRGTIHGVGGSRRQRGMHHRVPRVLDVAGPWPQRAPHGCRRQTDGPARGHPGVEAACGFQSHGGILGHRLL